MKNFGRMMRKALLLLPIFICVCLLLVNATLMSANHTMRIQLKALRGANGPIVGAYMTHLPLKSIKGGTVTTMPLAQSVIMFAFSNDCRYCMASRPVLAQLINDEPGTRMVYLNLASRNQDVVELLYGVMLKETDLFANIDEPRRLMYNLRVTPTLIVLDSKGIVRGAWPGLLSASDAEEVKGTLKQMQSGR